MPMGYVLPILRQDKFTPRVIVNHRAAVQLPQLIFASSNLAPPLLPNSPLYFAVVCMCVRIIIFAPHR